MNERITQLGGLTCRLVEGEQPELAVVLCHGFGAPGTDLVPLAEEVVRARPELGSKVRFVFPAAPLMLDAMTFGESRAWWHIDMARLALSSSDDRAAHLRREEPEGLPRARRHLLALIDELSQKTGMAIGRMVLGGFSQGSMLTTDVALRLEEKPAALLALSGTLLTEEEWTRRAPIRRGLKVLQSHGTQDPILPFANAEALRELLTHAGLDVEFFPFPGGHTIPYDMIERTAELLADLLKTGAKSDAS